MLNLERFENQFAVQIASVENGEDLREFYLGKDDLEKGLLNTMFRDENVVKLDKDVVLYDNTRCNVFVNGIMVKDLKGELNI